MPNNYIEDIILKDIQFVVSGGGTLEDSKKQVKEYTPETLGDWWPEFYLVGTLPSHGIYARHIKGLTIDNFSVKTISKDLRPAVKFDDILFLDINRIKSNGENIEK